MSELVSLIALQKKEIAELKKENSKLKEAHGWIMKIYESRVSHCTQAENETEFYKFRYEIFKKFIAEIEEYCINELKYLKEKHNSNDYFLEEILKKCEKVKGY